jgi:hypothetical protein
MDGGNNYILIEDYWMYGDARQFAPDGGGELYYIVGIDDLGREITKHSNIIRPDDAPLPVFVGFPDDGVSTAGYDMTANELLLHFNGDLADTSGNGLDVAPYDGGSWFAGALWGRPPTSALMRSSATPAASISIGRAVARKSIPIGRVTTARPLFFG